MWPCPAVSFELVGEVCSGTIIGLLCGLLQSTDMPEDVARIPAEVRFLSGHATCLQSLRCRLDRTWMQAFLSICSSNTLCFLHTSHYHPSQFLTYCMLVTMRAFAGFRPSVFGSLLAACPCYKFVRQSEFTNSSSLRSARQQMLSGLAFGKASTETAARALATNDTPCRPPSSSRSSCEIIDVCKSDSTECIVDSFFCREYK